MNGRGRVIWIAALATVALGCAVLAAYLFSVLWWGAWAYSDLFLPLGSSVVGAVVALSGVAILLSRRSGWVSVRTALLLTVSCCAVTAGLFFTLLANCRLSCDRCAE